MTEVGGRPVWRGSRHDPHAQIREARSAPILLHSLSLFRELFEDIYTHRKISTVVEVGVETGQVSEIYVELGASRVFCVDPLPSDELRSSLAGNDALELVEAFSPDVLGDLPVADLYVIDGDHNYATVRGEVAWILENAPDAVVVFHDLLWPSGRRDAYYQPTRLSGADRHPDTDEGPTVWHDGTTPAGFVGAGAFTWATEAGGERNGVLTAVEDALEAGADTSWRLEIVPAVFGVGVLARVSEETAGLFEAVRRYSGSRLLAALENNRIALYTRVLQLQHEAAARAGEADRMAETISAQRHRIEQLAADLAGAEANRDRACAEARAAEAALAEKTSALGELRRLVGGVKRRLLAGR